MFEPGTVWFVVVAIGIAAALLAAVGFTVVRRRDRRPGSTRRGARPGTRSGTRPGTRSGARPGARPGAGSSASAAQRPGPGEIWWATVPFVDVDGEKYRPCVVLWVRARHAQVLQVTSQDKSWSPDHIRLPRAGWAADTDKDSWLEIGQVRKVPYRKFDRLAGNCPNQQWQQVLLRYPRDSAVPPPRRRSRTSGAPASGRPHPWTPPGGPEARSRRGARSRSRSRSRRP